MEKIKTESYNYRIMIIIPFFINLMIILLLNSIIYINDEFFKINLLSFLKKKTN